MQRHESDTCEFKRTVSDSIKKDIVAFVNTNGGTIYIGVDDDGTAIGLDDPDMVIQQVSNMVRDSIRPDATMFVRYETLDAEGSAVLAVETQQGTDRPYYLANKGLRPEGVYVRQGTSAAPASESAIRAMVRQTAGDSFEEARSLEQELTFEAAHEEFSSRELDFGEPQMRTLGLSGPDGMYTNLALLLSDQCAHTIKLATFADEGQGEFQDRRECTGSLFAQLAESYEYLDVRNQRHASFEGLYRTDTRDYPPEALREALLNAVVHRDYAYSASVQVSVYADRIEVLSVGGLLPGIGLDDVLMGLSICRNPKLANVFYRLGLIEAYGTGLRKIMQAYKDSRCDPRFLVTGNAFKVVLPNRNYKVDEQAAIRSDTNSTESGIDGNRDCVLELAARPQGVTRKEVQSLLGIGQTAAGNLLRSLVEGERLTIVGGGRSTRYVTTEQRR